MDRRHFLKSLTAIAVEPTILIEPNFKDLKQALQTKNPYGSTKWDSLKEYNEKTEKDYQKKLKNEFEKLGESEKKQLITLYSSPKEFLESLKKQDTDSYEETIKFNQGLEKILKNKKDCQIKTLNNMINKSHRKETGYELDLRNLSDRLIYYSLTK